MGSGRTGGDRTSAAGEVAFVHNFCSHYARRTFELLARRQPVRFFFESGGDEWYWSKQHGVERGEFPHEYLPGFRLLGTRVTPRLLLRLWERPYAAFIKSINGRFTLPLTYATARLRGRPFILWTGVWTRIATPGHRVAWPLTRLLYRRADAIVAYGEHVKRYLIGEGVPAERIFVAPHAVDNRVYAREVSDAERDGLRARLGIGPDRKVVLFVGRLVAWKGLEYLLDAFASLRRDGAVLVVAGDGPDRAALEARARRLGIEEEVRFAGYVPVAEAVGFYAIADLCVLPSVTTPAGKEAWGLVVNEAFNQGVPVVATDAVGAAAGSLVRDGENGLVVPERDAAALGAALARLLDDGAERARMSAAARRSIAPWTQERMVAAFEAAIAFVTGRTASLGEDGVRETGGRHGAA